MALKRLLLIVLKVLGGLVATPLILLIVVFAYTKIKQLQPEPLADSFNIACDYELFSEYGINYRQHRYYNWPTGIYYSEQGQLKISSSQAASLYRSLQENTRYEFSDHRGQYENIGDFNERGTCAINLDDGLVSYTVTLS